MLTASLFVLLFVVCPLQTNAQNVTVSLANSQAVSNTVKEMLDEKLPPNAEARDSGNMLLDSVQKALSICDEALIKDQQILKHTNCVAETKVWAMISVGELVGQSWAKSGASRPGLFC